MEDKKTQEDTTVTKHPYAVDVDIWVWAVSFGVASILVALVAEAFALLSIVFGFAAVMFVVTDVLAKRLIDIRLAIQGRSIPYEQGWKRPDLDQVFENEEEVS